MRQVRVSSPLTMHNLKSRTCPVHKQNVHITMQQFYSLSMVFPSLHIRIVCIQVWQNLHGLISIRYALIFMRHFFLCTMQCTHCA